MLNTVSHPSATLVIGAGELGLAMLRGLLGRGDVTRHGGLHVLLRRNDAQRERDHMLEAMGVAIVHADLGKDTVDQLAGRFANYTTVICCTGFVGGAGTQRKITAAVLKAGVHRYVPWQFGVDYDVVGRGSGQDVWDEQLDVRDMLRAQSGTRWTIVSTGMFTSFLFDPSFGVVDIASTKVNALGSWDYRLTVTTPEDIGRVTAAILAQAPRHDNQVVHIAGDTLSYAQLADRVEACLGRPVTRSLWNVAALRELVDAQPDDIMRKYHLAFARATGVAWDKKKTFNGVEGIAMTDVPTWLADHISRKT